YLQHTRPNHELFSAISATTAAEFTSLGRRYAILAANPLPALSLSSALRAAPQPTAISSTAISPPISYSSAATAPTAAAAATPMCDATIEVIQYYPTSVSTATATIIPCRSRFKSKVGPTSASNELPTPSSSPAAAATTPATEPGKLFTASATKLSLCSTATRALFSSDCDET
ncbi:hypothetical protein K457DRAFT_899756, partial [Linnemannia elongata AG-77]